MNILEAIGLIGGIASLAGLLYAIYYARKNRRVKLLLYDTSWSVPLATAQSPENDYSLSVLFQRTGQKEEKINSAHVQFLRFANLGKEPIRRTDIAPENPLKIIVNNVRTLDISLSDSSRSVSKIEVSNVNLGEGQAEAEITFDFLDFQDGAVVKVLTEGSKGKIGLVGDIIGMPEGIRRSDEVRSLGLLNKIGCTLGGLLQATALVLTVFAYRWITGAWSHVWVLFLPFLALILPGVIIAIIASTIWPDEEIPLPATLALPKWFRRLPHYRMLRHPEAREIMLFGGPDIRDEGVEEDENIINQQTNSADAKNRAAD